MLLGLLLTAVSIFAVRHHTEAEPILAERYKTQKTCAIVEHIESLPVSQFRLKSKADVFDELSPESDFFKEYGGQIEYDATKVNCDRIKNLKIDNLDIALGAFVGGLYGFVGGFCIWLLYRLVRFAIKG